MFLKHRSKYGILFESYIILLFAFIVNMSDWWGSDKEHSDLSAFGVWRWRDFEAILRFVKRWIERNRHRRRTEPRTLHWCRRHYGSSLEDVTTSSLRRLQRQHHSSGHVELRSSAAGQASLRCRRGRWTSTDDGGVRAGAWKTYTETSVRQMA